jgi:hypothetical protein
VYVSAWLCFAYIASFGKQQGWLQSESIILAMIAFVVLMALFITRAQREKRPFINLKILKDASLDIAFVFDGPGCFYGNVSCSKYLYGNLTIWFLSFHVIVIYDLSGQLIIK